MRNIINVILSLRGIVSEPARHLIARRFADVIGNSFAKEEDKKHYLKTGVASFLSACDVSDVISFVPNDLSLEPTKLACFCNRWMSVQAFREPGERDWTPITVDMDSLRRRMVFELQNLAAGTAIDELDEN